MDDLIRKIREGNLDKEELKREIEDKTDEERRNENITKDMVMKKLSEVIDPELGIDIVSMNLIKDIRIDGGNVYIKMTLTIPGCPLMDVIVAEVKHKVSQIPGVKSVDVEIVF